MSVSICLNLQRRKYGDVEIDLYCHGDDDDDANKNAKTIALVLLPQLHVGRVNEQKDR